MKMLLGILRFTGRWLKRLLCLLGFLLICGVIILIYMLSSSYSSPAIRELNQKVKTAYSQGTLRYRLTEPAEFEKIFGIPIYIRESRDASGGWNEMVYEYPDFAASFMKTGTSRLYTLRTVKTGGIRIPSGPYPIVLGRDSIPIGPWFKVEPRNKEDLNKLQDFEGLKNLSLKIMDLRDCEDVLNQLDFNSRTQWPEAERLPPQFRPAELVEQGKNPGLGIRQLHAQGIDGRGVGIAIIDQSLLKNHQEYQKRLRASSAYGLARACPPQMHSAAVASIAVGKDCGIAPEAGLYFYQTLFTGEDNQLFCTIIGDIIKQNQTLSQEKIRVISISTGMFRWYKNYDQWKKTLETLEKEKIFLISCDTDELNYGTLCHVIGKDPDDANSFIRGRYGMKDSVLLVPAGNRTIAASEGTDVYTFDRTGGMSWVAPYLAGLAAMAYQVNPDITPQAIRELLVQTATKTEVGPVVNPEGFIRKISELKTAH